MQLQQGKQIAKSNLLRKCGLLAHTSPAFLKNCWIKKLFGCLRLGIGNNTSKENGLSHPAKGGSTPAFAYQHAAIAPLPCSNLQPWFSWCNFVWMGQLQKMQLQQGKQIAKSNLLRKCGLLAHTSAAFLKNCCTEKLFSSPAARFFYHNSNKKTGISLIWEIPALLSMLRNCSVQPLCHSNH